MVRVVDCSIAYKEDTCRLENSGDRSCIRENIAGLPAETLLLNVFFTTERQLETRLRHREADFSAFSRLIPCLAAFAHCRVTVNSSGHQSRKAERLVKLFH